MGKMIPVWEKEIKLWGQVKRSCCKIQEDGRNVLFMWFLVYMVHLVYVVILI